MDDEDGDGDEKDAPLITDLGGSSPVETSWLFFPAASVSRSSTVAGVLGTKNFAPTSGFTDGTAGDWKVFVKEPLPLLNVSTYLKGDNGILTSLQTRFILRRKTNGK